MAETYFAGGSMHGDLALVEASLSARAFLHLVNLGVPFPTDAYGQFVGYKTDHDPRQRATSIGPYTSQEMCRALIREAGRLRIPLREGRFAIALITVEEVGVRRAAGALALNGRGQLEIYEAENVVYATGGPGGLYNTSVYPEIHTGGIGVALLGRRQGAEPAGVAVRPGLDRVPLERVGHLHAGGSPFREHRDRRGERRAGVSARRLHLRRRDELDGLPEGLSVAVRLPEDRRRARL